MTYNNSKFLMPVVCIKSSPNLLKGGKEGEKYFIDRMSIYMDNDGDAYGYLYNDNEGKELMANVLLNRFMSI